MAIKGNPDQALQVPVQGFSYSMLDEAGSSILFKNVAWHSSEHRSLSLASDDIASLHATHILSEPDFITSSLATDGRSVRVSIADGANWGLQTGSLMVGLSSPDEPKAEFPVSANVLGAVRPDHNPVSFGMAAAAEPPMVSVRLSAENHKPFRVGKIALDGVRGKVASGPCKTAADGCRQVQLQISPQQSPGVVNGEMDVSLPDYGKTLRLKITGILVAASGTKPSGAGSTSKSGAAGAEPSDQPARTRAGNAVRMKPRSLSLPPPDPPGKGPVLRWTVANEQPLYGYLIYRAEHKDGPWQRVNDKIIPVLGHDDATSEYAWRDTSAVKGKTYWYFIKTLANNGSKKKLTEAQKVVAH